MSDLLSPTASRAIKSASADEVSAMTAEVIETDRAVVQINEELDMLASALTSLSINLETSAKKKKRARSMMQSLTTKL